MRIRLLIASLSIGTLLSISPQQVFAACLTSPVSASVIERFQANPQSLVDPNSDARAAEGMTRDLAGTDASLAVDLVSVAKRATPRFRTAIAAGLAQAATACESLDQKAALLIQQAVANFEDGEFQASFAAVAGDLSTAATDAAVSSATSSAGSVTVVNPNPTKSAIAGGSGGAVAALTQITSPGLIIITPSGLETITTTTANSVSPTR
jgi:hypothetical protein